MSSTTSNSSVKPLQNQTQNWTGPTEPKSDIYSVKDFHFWLAKYVLFRNPSIDAYVYVLDLISKKPLVPI